MSCSKSKTKKHKKKLNNDLGLKDYICSLSHDPYSQTLDSCYYTADHFSHKFKLLEEKAE